MNKGRFAEVQSHFFDAVDLVREDRELYLQHLRAEAPDIADEVEALLRSHANAEDFFSEEQPAPGMRELLSHLYDGFTTPETLGSAPTDVSQSGSEPTFNFDFHEAVPQQIGPFPVLQKLGAGGMGEVYLVQQFDPVKKKVALKVLNRAHTSKEALARFRAEAQALALMQHRNIAQLYQFEAKDPRLAYFTMEYIVGEPIHAHCEHHELSVEARVSLFLQVCDGVFHAHQKGIIHRDLKPNNIMIATQDHHPEVKVIDFGIAKAIEGEGRDAIATMMTVNNGLVGTPAYMPPEQVAEENGKSHVDTRSDIYAMGAILYQLLTDQTLIDPFEFRQMNWGQRIDCLRNPRAKKPSVCLQALGEFKHVAENRGLSGKGLLQKLTGDLDLVIMKCLAIEQDERYASVDQLRGDLQAWLDGRPVSVMPPSTLYRFKKYVKRNRGPVIAGMLVLLSLVTGLSAALMSRQNALAARELAVEAQGETESALKKADAVQRFLQSIIASPDPYTNGPDVKLVDVLRDAESKISVDFAGQPEVEARIRYSIGKSYDSLGLLVEARQQLEIADLILKDLNVPIEFWLDFQITLGMLKTHTDQLDGETVLLKALEVARAESLKRHELNAKENLAGYYSKENRYEKAIVYYQKCILLSKDLELNDVVYRLGLANSLHNSGKVNEASSVFEELYDEHKNKRNALQLQILIARIKSLITQNRMAESKPFLDEAKKLALSLFGESHYYTLFVFQYAGIYYANIGAVDEAFNYVSKAYNKRLELYGKDHYLTMSSRQLYVSLLVGRIPVEDALQELLSYASDLEKRVEHNTDAFLMVMNNAAYCYNQLGEYEKAISTLERVFDKYGMGYNKRRLMYSFFNIGESYFHLDNYEKSIESFERSSHYAEFTFEGVEYFKTYTDSKIGMVLVEMGEVEKGRSLILKALEHHRNLEHSALLSEIEESFEKLPLVLEKN